MKAIKISLFVVCLMASAVSLAQNGTIGPLTWSLSGTSPNYTLTISGNGAMPDFTQMSPNISPWYLTYRSSITAVVIGNGVTSIGNYAFYLCTNLTSVSISNSVTSIGNYAFAGCNTLGNITIPNGVTNIGNYAFSLCSALKNITIPNGVTNIGDAAFNSCTGLISITSHSVNPPTAGNNAFQNVNIGIPVYVPCTSKSTYRSAYGWNGFTNYVGLPDTSFVFDTVCSGTIYTSNGFNIPALAGVHYRTDTCHTTCLTLALYPNDSITQYWDTLCYGEVYNGDNFKNKTEEGIYYDTLQNKNGCDSIICLTLSYYPSVPITQYADTICQGETYTDVHFSGLTKAGTYYDTLQNVNGCDSIIILTLVVNPLPDIPVVSPNGTVLTASSADYYQWYFNGAAISGATGQSYVCTQIGMYYVVVTNEHGCIAQSENVYVTDVGIMHWTMENAQWTIYPNPTTGELIIDNGQWTMDNVKIFDITGRTLNNYPLSIINSQLKIDVSSLSSGIYYLKIDNRVVKFVKE